MLTLSTSLSLSHLSRDVSSIGFPFNVPSSALRHMTSENIDCFSTPSHPMLGHIRTKHRSSIRKNIKYYTPPSNPNPPPLRPKKEEEEETTTPRQPEVYCKSAYSFVIFKRLLSLTNWMRTQMKTVVYVETMILPRLGSHLTPGSVSRTLPVSDS